MERCMKMNLQARDQGYKAVPPAKTFDFGFKDRVQSMGMNISCGRLIERTRRTKIFYRLHNIDKV